MLAELQRFKETSLYQHFRDHFRQLTEGTMLGVVNNPLTNITQLFTREAEIGEARAAMTILDWFEILQSELEFKQEQQ